MATKIYRTVFSFEVLSEEPINCNLSLSDLYEMTMEGHCLVKRRFLDNPIHNEELVGLAAVEAIRNQGTDPEFFQMDYEGKDTDNLTW
jgi:hypothetical protein